MGPDGKANRPYFPVTTKPRDHDPVKQQMYEAYLEWRKANEPGYHMKCKMRQANRVMRQCQQQQDKVLASNPANWKAMAEKKQQEKTLASNPANWKEIAEKAKAAVGAAAAAAAAEKKLRQESVREELRVKVKELSRDSQTAVEVGA
jgi:ATPase subunit of ABC transporter with duplicated ATPase domains